MFDVLRFVCQPAVISCAHFASFDAINIHEMFAQIIYFTYFSQNKIVAPGANDLILDGRGEFSTI